MIGVLLIVIALLIVFVTILLLGAFQKNEPLVDVLSFQGTIKKLKREVPEKENKILQQGIENHSLKESNNSFENTISSLTYELSQKSRELLRKDNECAGKDSLIRGLNFQCNDLNDSLKKAKEDAERAEWAYSEQCEKCEAMKIEIERLNERLDSFDAIIDSKNPFDYVAHLRAHALEHARGYENAKTETLASLFKYQYKFEYLLSIYPELSVYRDDDAYIQYIQEEEQKCNIKNWLSDDEYKKLSEVEREQLAVDRYIVNYKSNWSNWEKGRNYEIYVAYMLYNDKKLCNDGYDIIQEGLNKKLEDKGRDIIATHRKTGQVLIVQCKNWSERSVIRENVIFQLYGSYMQWLVDNSKSLADDVVPCLYYTCQLSPVAIECARMLKVRCVPLPMGRFPVIKCNVNHNTGQLIYHLPFDRHYDLVKINAKGKGYKFKIAEAIDEGFRRAYNH